MSQDRRFQKKTEEEVDEAWMTTFADMVTLLLAFFILLTAISKVDVVLYEQVKAGMAKGIGNREVTTPVQMMRRELEETVKAVKADDSVAVGTDAQGVTIEFAAGSFYEAGSAELREDIIPILNRIGATIQSERYSGFLIEVQGHTDDTPINTPEFPSNWELSGARASRVVRHFQTLDIDPARMKAIGYADTAPKVPNRDAFGDPLPQNQEVNRRVVVRLSPR